MHRTAVAASRALLDRHKMRIVGNEGKDYIVLDINLANNVAKRNLKVSLRIKAANMEVIGMFK
jgi:hypothetical protein